MLKLHQFCPHRRKTVAMQIDLSVFKTRPLRLHEISLEAVLAKPFLKQNFGNPLRYWDEQTEKGRWGKKKEDVIVEEGDKEQMKLIGRLTKQKDSELSYRMKTGSHVLKKTSFQLKSNAFKQG